mmetsp:Transcript_22607/g.38277  ORF Transcript_22607/g.38277 Transcript_22607/m.38277 type:complete len:982 (+) Transcript_22607:233-3178(+)
MPKAKVNDKDSQTKRIKKLRVAVFVCLLITSCFFALGAYIVLDNLEEQLQHQLYDTVVAEFQTVTLKSIKDETHALEVTAAVLADKCPESSSWPNCKMSMETFTKFTLPLQSMSSYQAISFSSLLKTEELAAYETFSTDFWDSSGYGDLNISENVFARSAEGEIYTEVDSSSAKGKYDIVVPVFQISPLENNKGAVLFNIYSEINRATTIDYAIDSVPDSGLPSTGISEFIFLVQDELSNAASLIMHPIVPLNHNETVGLAVGVLRWDTFFLKYVPSYADGITVILSDGNSEAPYSFVKDDTTGITRVDYNPNYKPSKENSWSWKTFELDTLGSSSYSITVHFEDSFAEEFRTNNPYYVMCVSLIVTLVTSLLFVLYDYFTNRQSIEQQIVSNTRREFVRYISHEIRTPMNTIHIGVSILFDEISGFFSSTLKKSGSISMDSAAMMTLLTDWLSLISNVSESSEEAILVLNDIINYDKIQMNLIQLEKESMDTLSMLNRTIGLFILQAKKKNINFIVDLKGIENAEGYRPAVEKNDETITTVVNLPIRSGVEISDVVVAPEAGTVIELAPVSEENEIKSPYRLMFFGDKVKLAQVIRNLVSNALKFTPENGTVKITGTYDENETIDESDDITHSDDVRLLRRGVVTFCVKDSGAGMSIENQMELFQEGKQFNPNKLQAGEGSGLGLYIAKQLVEMHNGSLSAISEGEGKGAEFILKIPAFIHKEQNGDVFHQSEANKSNSVSEQHGTSGNVSTIENIETSLSLKIQSFLQTMNTASVTEDFSYLENRSADESGEHDIEMGSELSQVTPPPSAQVSFGSLSQTSIPYGSLMTSDDNADEVNVGRNNHVEVDLTTLHVLIVDDVGSTRKIMERLLRRRIAKISLAVNGQECVDFFTKNSAKYSSEIIDIVLLDYEMPILNGPDAAKCLRSQGCTVPIIGVTGNTLPEEKEVFLKAGADQVLTKPVNLESLLHCMSTLLNKSTA